MSPTGRTVAALVVSALTALWLPEVAFVLIGIVLVMFVLDAASVRRGPVVERSVATDVVRGIPVDFAVGVDAAGRRCRVRQIQTADLRFDPAEAPDSLAGTMVATRRGHHELPPVVTRTWGPLGMGRWTHQHLGPAAVESHANLPGARRIAVSVQEGRFIDEGMRRGELGLGTDFETIRDYTPDDDIRRMNWRATERVGRPMVNQYREDTDRDLWCLIDTGRLLSSPLGDRTRLDVALDAVAAVAAVADVVGDRAGAVVFDDQVRRVIRPRRASAAGLVRSLDALEPSIIDSDYEAAFARMGQAKRSLVVVFTDLLDVAAARPLLDATPVLVRRHAVVIASVTDADLLAALTTAPATQRDLSIASVSRDLMAERQVVAAQLAAAGAMVVDAPVDSFPSACVAAYLRLKATARI